MRPPPLASPVGFLRLADDLLRGSPTPSVSGRSARSWVLFLLILGYGLFYGGVMGTYGGLSGNRPLQVVYSSVKVPLLILVTFALSLPSFYVINALLGLRPDFPAVLRALLTAQACLTVILASLSPFTAFWYASKTAYQPAVLFNGAMFAVASFASQWVLRREYALLIREDEKHRWMLRAWIFIYVFVGIQMAWVLRPFIGDPALPVQFFREERWTNAYEVVLAMLWGVLTGEGR